MRQKLIYIYLLFISITMNAQEQSYGTLTQCTTCDIVSYLGTYKIVGYMSRLSDDRNLYNWKPLELDDYYVGDEIIIQNDKFLWNSGAGDETIIIDTPIYTIDKYRLENRGEPYFENDRFMRNKLSYYSQVFDRYGDFTYLISVRHNHINNGNNNYIIGDYFLEIHGANLVLSTNKKFYLLEKTH